VIKIEVLTNKTANPRGYWNTRDRRVGEGLVSPDSDRVSMARLGALLGIRYLPIAPPHVHPPPHALAHAYHTATPPLHHRAQLTTPPPRPALAQCHTGVKPLANTHDGSVVISWASTLGPEPTLSPLLAGRVGECQRGARGAVPHCGMASHNVEWPSFSAQGPLFQYAMPPNQVPPTPGRRPQVKTQVCKFFL